MGERIRGRLDLSRAVSFLRRGCGHGEQLSLAG